MSAFHTLDDLDVAGKTVLVRGDLNVPMKDGQVTDTTRLDRLAGTLLELADKGVAAALRDNPALQRGLNTLNGQVVHPGVAAAFDLPRADVNAVLSAQAE